MVMDGGTGTVALSTQDTGINASAAASGASASSSFAAAHSLLTAAKNAVIAAPPPCASLRPARSIAWTPLVPS